MILKVKKLYDEACIPSRAHMSDAGIDLYAYQYVTIQPHATVVVPTGIALEMETGYVGLIWDKSSIGSKGVKTLGGVVDAGYRGEVKVIIHNMSDIAVTFDYGQKIAQMLIQKVELCEVQEVCDLDETTRGEGAFGSTGK